MELVQLQWGFAPGRPKAPPVINFRSEGRRFPKGRCLVPASHFFEFTGKRSPKSKWKFTKTGDEWFCFAGIWRPENGDVPEAFTLLTTAPGPDVAPIHDRQMVVLERRDWLAVGFQEVVHLVRTEEAEVVETSVFPRRDQMNSHKNAALTPKGREAMVRRVEAGLNKAAAARQFNTTPKTVAKWVERFRAGGVDGLRDRSSRPLSLPSQTASATCAVVEALRRQRYTGKQIAAEVGVSAATVSRILQRLGINKLSALEPAEPVRRYEREHPGDIIHIDIKKLGRFEQIGHRITGDRKGQSNSRGVGWEYLHREYPKFCVRDFCEGGFAFWHIEREAIAAR